MLNPDIKENRKPDHPILDEILNRYSPRVLNEEEVTHEELLSCLEAARWAPSSSNTMPWKFIIAKKGTDSYETQRDLLVEFNQKWTKNATYLITLVSTEEATKPDGSEATNRNHTSDAGAAWENFAIQAASMDLVAHGMAGYDHEKAREVLNVPDEYRVEFMIAVGRRTPLDEVPEEFKEGETPNDRRPIEYFTFEGEFGNEFEV